MSTKAPRHCTGPSRVAYRVAEESSSRSLAALSSCQNLHVNSCLQIRRYSGPYLFLLVTARRGANERSLSAMGESLDPDFAMPGLRLELDNGGLELTQEGTESPRLSTA
ncbi:hypothetical protein TorRG33x02_232800 [Trema orientale]|uniref:Uncharacterized protein n=1 Tax=Trema orientale TaxID=63057 RepID=A0A2P5E5W8_TREOI|nr:hypothetical protein TorRG33x02_232800 [Trema orientale]